MASPVVLYLSQVALFSLIPLLFLGAKAPFRRALFYTYLGIVLSYGGFIGQVWSVQLSDSVTISGGSVAYVTFIMVTILFVVLEQDTAILKNIVFLVVAVNLFQYLLFRSTGAILSDSRFINPFNMTPDIFSVSLLLMLTGGVLIILELVIFLFAFQKLGRFSSNPVIAALVFTLLFFGLVLLDGVLFPLVNWWLFPDMLAVIYGGFEGKVVLGISFAPVMLLFLWITHRQFKDFLEMEFSLNSMLGQSKEDLANTILEERQRSEEHLLALNAELEQRVEERTVALAASNKALQEANAELELATHAKSDFLASMSHELRTPLNSVIGFSTILLSGAAGELNEEQHRQQEMINSSGKHLLALVNDILDLSKIEAGKIELEIEDFSLREIMSAVVGMLNAGAEDKGLEVDVTMSEPEAVLHTDLRAVEQILINLAGNAVKFTDEGVISLDAFVTQEDRAVFRVRDTGSGIPEESFEAIFDPFRQVGQPRGEGQQKGTGLGLAICALLAQRLGGILSVDSTLGEGSTFTLDIPASIDESAEAH